MKSRRNAALSALEKFQRFGLLRRGDEVRAVEDLRSQLAIRTPTIETAIANLSGGVVRQQMGLPAPTTT